tara:strand:- start:148 stop:627 length:480 start_codon:yes stop_codon:yes gene_type:complete
MIVLSIDPGIGVTGFSIIHSNGQKSTLSAYGTIKPKSNESIPKRLNYLFEEVNKLLNQFSPNVLAVEDSFYSNNVKSAMILGQARASILLPAVQADIPIHQFAPRKVKMSVCGNGAASKEQVSYMVSKILKLKVKPKPLDISDAIAVGLCYINQIRFHD